MNAAEHRDRAEFYLEESRSTKAWQVTVIALLSSIAHSMIAMSERQPQ